MSLSKNTNYPNNYSNNIGNTLLTNVNDVIKTIEEMRSKKDLLKTQIMEEEEEKIKIENELAILTERLEKTNEVIMKLTNEFQDIEKTIFDTENARAKIADSFKTLLSVLQKESFHYTKGKN